MSANNELYTRSQLAAKLRISTRSLDRYCKAGIIKRVKLGGKVLFAANSLPPELTAIAPEILTSNSNNAA